MLRCTHETQLPAHARSLEQRAIIIRSTYNPTATCSTRTRHFACTAAMIRAAPPQVAAVLEASSAPSRAQLPHLSTSHIGRATVWHRFSQPIAANPLSVALPAALERGREAAWIKLAISRSVGRPEPRRGRPKSSSRKAKSSSRKNGFLVEAGPSLVEAGPSPRRGRIRASTSPLWDNRSLGDGGSTPPTPDPSVHS